MYQRVIISLGAAFILAACGNPVFGQAVEGGAKTLDLGEAKIKYKITGDEVPLYTVVSWFFRRVDGALNATGGSLSSYRRILLRELGIEPGSPAEEFLAEMATEAVNVLSVSDTNRDLKGDEYTEYQYKAATLKAKKLGIVFRNLREGLSEAGVSLEQLDTYCETQVRRSISIISTEDDKERFLAVVAEFDRQLLQPKQ